MGTRWFFRGATAAWLAAAAQVVPAANYNEPVQGDISSNPAAPTSLGLIHGSNLVTATTGGGDFDFLRVTVPNNHTLDTIVLNSYSGATQSFVGIQSGNTWTAGTGAGMNAASLLGWTHFGPAASGAGVGQDLFDNMSVGAGAIGFARPLLSGAYTLLFQDTGGAVSFSMQFNLTYRVPTTPGDFNFDFAVDWADLEQWETDFGVNGGSDADVDGDSDGADFVTWQRNHGNFGIVGVPESSTAALAAGAAAAMAAAALRKRVA